jgi:elongator complex protein 3
MPHRYTIDLEKHRDPLLTILQEVLKRPNASPKQVDRITRKHPRPEGGLYGRSELIEAYRSFAGSYGLPPFDEAVLETLRRKPIRTTSGVTPVTVMTKPFPCPGTCIFCPNDVRMPKSYLSNEPGAQRAEQNAFDPYLQMYTRLQAFYNTAHPLDKLEIIVLGGTWSFYPESYQIWFIKRLFDALHDFGKGIDRRAEVRAALYDASQLHPERNQVNVTLDGRRMEQTYNQVVQAVYRDEMYRSREIAQQIAEGRRQRSLIDEYATWEELEAAHRENETADCRCVGLVIETRPDQISPEEVLRIRRLGCTKVQIGFQSLDDEILGKNKRGHTVAATRRAVKLLRQAGFKIHAHWMPNLYGATPQSDIEDFRRMFDDSDFRPDELKIYPCSLIESAELMQRYQDGSWQPYTQDELLDLLVECFKLTPEYCRLTRVIRDIPGTDIVVGNRVTNFRQVVEETLAARGERSRDIRAREIRQWEVSLDEVYLDEIGYGSSIGEEIFLQFISGDRHIIGFLRLALPDLSIPPLTEELRDAAIIREVHVYGQALGIGEIAPGHAQHSGLGKRLIDRAVEIARVKGYANLAVISAVGTRDYYRKRGFIDRTLYQSRVL